VFDHVTASIIRQEQDAKGIVIQVKNETIHDANVSVFAETSAQAAKPLGTQIFLTGLK
jgi:hypothetical protein